eukprot:NODE_3663_length_1309_cov_41.837268_g3203_i0.p1 GENE.NODE_3663_length_1309_cov_41.837268_g3203_i0~~NODE_3663_length_1309_cov_41.837268_g3203_i0.p1  ORF type:complete len:321 (-),score=39.87 NODE_3663_length_1309_cov_41.837268_g3203_i0:120-1082(-)
MDGRVIDIPFIPRWILVNMIIAPFRSFESAKLYRTLFHPQRGSPLKYHGEDVLNLLQKELGDKYSVSLAMRYQNPSIHKALSELYENGVGHVIVVPMFPQYASATTGSVHAKVMEIAKEWPRIPHITMVSNFVDDENFVHAWETQAKFYLDHNQYDHILFSYHGVPERHVRKTSCRDYCKLNSSCCATLNGENMFCYRAQCFETTRRIAKALGLKDSQYTQVFQSRLGRDAWLGPSIDEVVKTFPSRNIKKVLVFSPAFVSDCLETTVELGVQYKEMHEKQGGEVWHLVESLNSSPKFIQCLKGIVEKHTPAHHQVPLPQ